MRNGFEWIVIAGVVATLGFESPASAQRDVTGMASQRQHSEIHFQLGGGYIHQFNANIDEGGDFDVNRFSTSLAARTRLTEDVSLSLQFNYNFDDYDFGGTALGVNNPWSDIHTIAFGAILSASLSNEFDVFGGPVFQFSRESGADWGDSIIAGGILGGSYHFNDQLTIGGGIGVVSQIEDSALVFPIIIIDWQLTDQLRLSSRGTAGSGGQAGPAFTGVELIWEPGGGLDFAIGAARNYARFRLENDNVGQDESIPFWVRAGYQASPEVRFDALVGVTAFGELKLDDAGGSRLAKEDYDSSPFIGIFGSVRF